MSVRDEFVDRLAHHLIERGVVANPFDAGQVAQAIVRLAVVRRAYEENEVTTLGNAEEQWLWSRSLVAEVMLPVESGTYVRPHRSGWLATP